MRVRPIYAGQLDLTQIMLCLFISINLFSTKLKLYSTIFNPKRTHFQTKSLVPMVSFPLGAHSRKVPRERRPAWETAAGDVARRRGRVGSRRELRLRLQPSWAWRARSLRRPHAVPAALLYKGTQYLLNSTAGAYCIYSYRLTRVCH